MYGAMDLWYMTSYNCVNSHDVLSQFLYHVYETSRIQTAAVVGLIRQLLMLKSGHATKTLNTVSW